MADYLAEVVMPEERTEDLTPEGGRSGRGPDIIEEQMEQSEEDIELEIAEAQPDEESEEEIPEPVRKREKIPQEEIFSPPKVKTILEPDPPPAPEKNPAPYGYTKAGRPRKKRVMTEKQLENLKKGRETSLANRKKKREMKLEQKKINEEDAELVQKYKAKERQRLKKQIETPLEEENKPIIVEKGYSQSQLDEAVAKAVEQSVNRVETLRKARKEVKKKAVAKKEHDAKVFKEINTALKNDVWANCFL